MSASVFSLRARTAPPSAQECDAEAALCQRQATDLTVMADELVTEAHLLPDSSPRRRALLQAARGLRLAADGFQDASDEYGQWARSLREARL
jgi:hypothetical protein